MRISYGQPCVKCGTPMAPSYGGTKSYRPAPAGMRYHYSGGWCRNCSTKARAVRGRCIAGRPASREPADWVKVDRAVNGWPADLNTAERQAAVDTLTARGWSARRIAMHLGLAQRSVVRIRTRERAAA
jgi:hypothetical protein